MCDVALDPYTSHGHDGVIFKKQVDNERNNKDISQASFITS